MTPNTLIYAPLPKKANRHPLNIKQILIAIRYNYVRKANRKKKYENFFVGFINSKLKTNERKQRCIYPAFA
jgi:hypothetical protein